MEQRTCNIIMCCKGNSRLPVSVGSWRRDVAVYMGRECEVPPERYSDETLAGIMLTAFYDYMETADHPGSDLRNYFGYFNPDAGTSDRIASVFALCQVFSRSGCVNGFTPELIEKSDIALGLSEE